MEHSSEQGRDLVTNAKNLKLITIQSRDPITRWSHKRRFAMARRMVKPFAGRCLADYGCGDGTFLTMVHDLFPDSAGIDHDRETVEACKTAYPEFRWLHTSQLTGERFGVLTCFEVLEHCVEPDVIVRSLKKLLEPDGFLVISVPVEIGPTFVAKRTVRAIGYWAGARPGLDRFRPSDYWRIVFAGKNSRLQRNINQAVIDGEPRRWHGHDGFNWRALKVLVEREFTTEQMRFSPFGVTSFISSQVYFVCKPR
jgi:SAM-dependent methyltransferase